MISITLLALVMQTQTFKTEGVALSVSKSTGSFDLDLGGGMKIANAYGEVKLSDGAIRKTTDFPNHKISSRKTRTPFGESIEVTLTHSGKGNVRLRQVFWLHKSEAFVRMDLIDPSGKGTNQLLPIASTSKVMFPSKGPLQSLFVPYDNDNYWRFSSNAWEIGKDAGDESSEVGAIYDDNSRLGLVIGSVDHDIWKSGVKFFKDGGLRVTAGVTSRFSHDTQPHGTVVGKEVRSPRFVIGRHADWRTGMERYGDLNAIVQPLLKWKGEVPFGWSSWSGHKSKVQAKDVDAALEFVRDEIPQLRSGGVAYINIDSFWDNMTREERVAFVKKAHASGLKAGIYWTPFVNWGEPDWKTSGTYHFRDLQLKNHKGEFLPKLDGGWPLDPTHPGTLLRMDENLKDFIDQGFDYIKLDFLTHGALEGKHHDPKITTGTAAYNAGMKYLVDSLNEKKVGRPIFIGHSIAPMFPHGYGHARRISCDIFSNIGASEYFLNSQNYGWWQAGRLYQYNDPDSACVYQALGEDSTTEAEARTRFTASVIGGGMMIEGDNLTDPAARQRVKLIFSNLELLNLAKKTPAFRPVWGDTGEKAGDLYIYRQDANTVYIAAFNFSKEVTKNASVPLARLGISGKWNTEELWTKVKGTADRSVDYKLLPTDCAVIRMTRKP